jgi:carbamoyl-phosphate synthase large subunit
MASTGEVGCIGDDLSEALLLGLLAAGFKMPHNGVLLSLGPLSDKYWFTDEARSIADDLKLPLYATEGTAEMLEAVGIDCTRVGKADEDSGSALAAMDDGRIDMVINIPRSYDDLGRPDGYLIRRRAVDIGIPLITDLQLARAVINALKEHWQEDLHVRAWGDYLERDVRVLM